MRAEKSAMTASTAELLKRRSLGGGRWSYSFAHNSESRAALGKHSGIGRLARFARPHLFGTGAEAGGRLAGSRGCRHRHRSGGHHCCRCALHGAGCWVLR